ncbi:hypothetical protein H0H93_000012 [Arthromyces matolae]|nr:hypothetical protein H0H93_000012 [Arthromyces matolae]
MDTKTLEVAPTIVTPQPIPSSTSSSSQLAPPIAGPSSKPISTAPVDIDPQSQGHSNLLVELGIKVRDFAYESKLPPVQPYRVRQYQPGSRSLKRTRQEDDVFQDNTSAIPTSSKRSTLVREDTEPDVSQHEPPFKRARGFAHVRSLARQPAAPPWHHSKTPPMEFPRQIEIESQSQSQPPLILESQDSEPYVVTPIVTPNGSLQWPDIGTTSDIPVSQLDSESQATDPVLLSFSQLGMPDPEPEPQGEERDTTGTGLVGKLTPMSSLSSIGSDVPPLTNPLSALAPIHASYRIPTSSPTPPKNVTPPIPASRYQLRRRPLPPSPKTPTKAGNATRNHNMYSSAYSRGKASRGREVRTHRGGASNETMIVR